MHGSCKHDNEFLGFIRFSDIRIIDQVAASQEGLNSKGLDSYQ